MIKETIHRCDKVKEIATLTTQVDTLMEIMKDNGHDGLPTTVIKLVTNTSQLTESVTELKIAINGFKMFQKEIEIRGEIELEQFKLTEQTKRDLEAKTHRIKRDKQWLIGILITLIIGSVSVYYTMRRDKRDMEKQQRELLMGTINSSSIIPLRSSEDKVIKNIDPVYHTKKDTLNIK